MKFAEKLELHYYLDNSSHSMDAFVRNKCEAEALAILQEISRSLGIHIVVESVAYSEGGLVEILQIIGKYKEQISLIPLFIALVLSRFPPRNKEQDELNKELTKLSIEEKNFSIEKMRKELMVGDVKAETLETASLAFDSNVKVAARKSNFYKNLIRCKKVTGIGLTPLNNDLVPTEKEIFIGRADFGKYILLTDKLPVEIIEDAKIEIVAPVLKEGNYHWKGIYEGTLIGFIMIDEEFKNSVLREDLSFQHGSIMECVLNIHRKVDEVGDIVVTGYSVVTVIKKIDGTVTFETMQGKRRLEKKKFIADQIGLFD